MGSKLILLLGLLVGGLLIFFCLNEDKREWLLNYKNSYLKEEITGVEPSTVVSKKREEFKEPLSVVALENNKSNLQIDRNISVNLLENSENLKEIKEKITTLLKDNPIYFKISSSTIHQDSKEGLNKIVRALKELSYGVVVTVEGHTDAIGDAFFNKKLSQKRANSIKFYLEKGGLDHLIIESIGYGEEQPLVNNPNDKQNRRVEIVLKRGE